MKMEKFVKIDSFIRDLCSELGDPDGSIMYVPLLRLSNRVIVDLNLNIIPVIKSIPVVVDDNLNADLPPSCVNPLKAVKRVSVGGFDNLCYPLGKRENDCVLIDRAKNFLDCNPLPEPRQVSPDLFNVSFGFRKLSRRIFLRVMVFGLLL